MQGCNGRSIGDGGWFGNRFRCYFWCNGIRLRRKVFILHSLYLVWNKDIRLFFDILFLFARQGCDSKNCTTDDDATSSYATYYICIEGFPLDATARSVQCYLVQGHTEFRRSITSGISRATLSCTSNCAAALPPTA